MVKMYQGTYLLPCFKHDHDDSPWRCDGLFEGNFLISHDWLFID